MKRKITIIAMIMILAMIVVLPIIFTGCQNRDEILKVYTWSEYLGEDVAKEFEAYYKEVTGKNVKVKIDYFDENETMYSQIEISRADYDVVCPSDYMIEKMIKNGLLLKLEDISSYGYEGLEDYRDGMSSLVMSSADGLFQYDYDPSTGKYNQYSRTYMWGTMGIMYGKNSTAYEDSKYGTYSSMDEYVQANGWAVFLDPAFTGKTSLKLSMRDTYVSASIYTLLNPKSANYNASFSIADALNVTDSATVSKIKNTLKAQKKLFVESNSGDDEEVVGGYEADQAKEWIVTGGVDIALQWAGDALYVMGDYQDELGAYRDIGYYVPQEGSNIFSDGWCIPKYAKNTEAANLWINFMCRPDIAVRNMDYICYTSGVASQEAFDYIVENWGSDDENAIAVDLTYFFGEDCGFNPVIKVAAEDYEAFLTLFPTQDIIARCAVMKDFGDATESMIDMWNDVRAD